MSSKAKKITDPGSVVSFVWDGGRHSAAPAAPVEAAPIDPEVVQNHQAALRVGEECASAARQDGTAQSGLFAAHTLGLTHLMAGRPQAAYDVKSSWPYSVSSAATSGFTSGFSPVRTSSSLAPRRAASSSSRSTSSGAYRCARCVAKAQYLQ